MRQVVLERLTFQKCSAVAMVSPVTVYARAWFPEGCHNYRAPSILTVRPSWCAAPKGAASSLRPRCQTGLGLPGSGASPAVLPSPVATAVVISSAIRYLARSLPRLPELWFSGGEGMWDCRVVVAGNMGLPVWGRELGVIPLRRWTAVLQRWTGFAHGYQSQRTAFCI